MALFNTGEYKLHSGSQSSFKIDCDYLSDKDLEAVADFVSRNYRFGEVISIPRGGDRLSTYLRRYSVPNAPVLIVDDVCTTGESLKKELKKNPEAIGLCLFCRDSRNLPDRVVAVFHMGSLFVGA